MLDGDQPAAKDLGMRDLLVFGRSGQVARELARRAADAGFQARFVDRNDADLTRPADCAALIATLSPHAVINAAAYTAVDAAETDEATARVVNADAPGAMAAQCARSDIPFLHISTDYVFDGSGTLPRDEAAATSPLGAYGRTKLDGEDAVRTAGGRWTVMRTSWVFSAHGNNFVKTMLRLGASQQQLNIVGDQIGGPTFAGDIADAALVIVPRMLEDRQAGGLYHFAGSPDVSWADFAREIFAQSGLTPDVMDIATCQYPTPAARPANSRLDCTAIQRNFSIARPDWRVGLANVIAELNDDRT